MKNPQYAGKVTTLVSVGDIKGKVPKRRAVPHGHIDFWSIDKNPDLILKTYFLQEQRKANPTTGDITDIWMVIEDQLKQGKLKRLSGLGFLIASFKIMNVCRWDFEHADVVVPQIYTLERDLWTPQKVEGTGAFCSGEKRIYDHENNAWLRFLSSRRIVFDKEVYLNDFLRERTFR